jgi:hypothetical protein
LTGMGFWAFILRAQRCRCALFVSLASREEPFHWSSGLVTETIPERRSGRSKSRPPHALIESRLNSYNYQMTLDWTTSFLSDDSILRLKTRSCQDVLMSGWLDPIEGPRDSFFPQGVEALALFTIHARSPTSSLFPVGAKILEIAEESGRETGGVGRT